MKHIIAITTFIFLTQFCLGQTNFTFTIEQVGLPNANFSKYLFDGSKLLVTENGRRKEKLKLNQGEIYQLDSIINSIGLDTLKESYSRPVMDGVHRTFTFNIDGKTKEIQLSNYYLESLDRFLIEVNNLLKEKHRLVSFGKDMLSKPDTMVYYLPDFYVDSFDIPANYDFYRIMCFRKGYFRTEILDSIHLCECRIYPTEKNGEHEKRHYWRAFRLDNNEWRREYYDNENHNFKTEFVQDVTPYKIVEEKIATDQGDKPSVKIYRYFKTKIKKE